MSDLVVPRDEQFWLNNQKDVLANLKQLYYDDTLVTLFHKQTFCLSTVVNYDLQHIWLDVAKKDEDATYLLNQPEIYLLSQTTSVPLFMELKDGIEVIVDGMPTWQFKLPTRVHKHQRREAFRVHYPFSLPTCVKLGGYTKKTAVIDLSLAGLGLVTEDEENLEVGAQYQLHLETKSFDNIPAISMDVNVIIRHIKDISNDKKKIGVQFHQLNRQQEAFLNKFQHHLQMFNNSKA